MPSHRSEKRHPDDAWSPTVHLNIGATARNAVPACGTKSPWAEVDATKEPGRVTCGSCRRTRIYKAAASRDVVPAAQPLSGIVLAPLACLSCGEPADEVNLSVNVSALTHDTGEYVPGDTERVSLSDRIGTSCPDCGITLDDSWPLTALVYVGKQNGEPV